MSDVADGFGGAAATQGGHLQAVMFDMDGLLVDTEPLWFEVETGIMARLGGTWSPVDQAALIGGSLRASVRYMVAKAAATAAEPGGFGHDGTAALPRAVWPPAAEAVAAWMVDGMAAKIAERGVPLLPGAAELLAETDAAGVPRALVTSSERPIMDAVLAQLGAANRTFGATVCAADVARTKPDPEPYLLAARRLGVDPARCAVLEDAPNGVSAAEAAGCMVIVVPGLAAVSAWDRAGLTRDAAGGKRRLVVSSLQEVSLAWLRRQAARTAAGT